MQKICHTYLLSMANLRNQYKYPIACLNNSQAIRAIHQYLSLELHHPQLLL